MISEPLVRVENLGKRYRLGQREPFYYRTLRDALVNPLREGFKRWRHYCRTRDSALGGMGERRETGDEWIWALREMSFEVKCGETLGIIGRNGAGKTTLLKILSRITEPTQGRVEILGRVGSLLEVGTGFHPELSGRENIYLNGAILGMKKAEIEGRFDEIVAFAEIEKFVDTPVKRYSSGMYVRLAFAVAAHLEPEILLVDEVLAVGDVAFQKKCLGKMEDVAREGRTVLFVSHNMHAVRNLCARVILLAEGRKVEDGDVDDVMRVYLSNAEKGAKATIDLPPGPRAAPMVGRHLRFVGADGMSKTVFRINEKWRIILEFELFQSLPHVIGAVGLRTLEGIPIMTYWSVPKDLPAGRYCVEFTMEAPLRACQISFVAGLSSNEKPIYHANDIGRVTIAEVAEGKQPYRISGKGGILLTECVSEIKPLPSESI